VTVGVAPTKAPAPTTPPKASLVVLTASIPALVRSAM